MDVSVVVPAYNVERYVATAVGSVLQDPGMAVEVIVIDDGSTDGTAAVVEAMAQTDGRIRLLRQPRNGGPSRGRNRGIEEARGTYVAFVDADDWCAPGRLTRLVEVAEAACADIVSDNQHLIDEGANAPWTDIHTEFGVAYGDAEPIRPLEFVRQGWVIKSVVRRSFLIREGLRFDPDVDYGEDYIFYVEALARGCTWIVCGAPTYYHLAREGSITHSGKTAADLLRYLGKAAAQAQAAGQADLARAFRHKQKRIGATLALRGFTDRGRSRAFLAAAAAAVRMVPYAPVYAERYVRRIDRLARKRALTARTADEAVLHRP